MANENVLINDVTINFAKLATAVTDPFGNTNYEMQIQVPADRAGELEAAGLKVKTEDGIASANVKRKATKRDGSDNGAPRVVGADRAPFDADKTRTIGNGSKGNVIVYKYDWEFGGKTGQSASLTAVQITDLEVYTAGGVDFEVVGESTGGEASPF